MSINFTSRFNVRQDGLHRNTVHRPRSDFSRDLYQNRESVYRKYFIILKQRPERIIEYLISTRQTRLKYTIFGSRKKWTTNINGNLPSVRRSSIWTSATTTTELPDRYSRLNTTEVWLHTFYSTVEHAALPTSYELCTIHFHCALAQPRPNKGTQGYYNRHQLILFGKWHDKSSAFLLWRLIGLLYFYLVLKVLCNSEIIC